MICYYCLHYINSSQVFLERGICPSCNRSVSLEDCQLLARVSDQISHDALATVFAQRANRSKLLGSDADLNHGAGTFIEFIVTAVVSGVLGNMSYDIIKTVTIYLFRRYYPEQDTVDAEGITKIVFDYLHKHPNTDAYIELTAERVVYKFQAIDLKRSQGEHIPKTKRTIREAVQEGNNFRLGDSPDLLSDDQILSRLLKISLIS